MITFKSKQALEGYVKGRLEDVMDDVYDKLLKKLLDIIKKDVYSKYTPSFYERTEDLLNKKNWTIERKVGRKYITRELKFNGEHYSHYILGERDNPSSYIHGNKYYGEFDSDSFLKMLNGKTKQGDNPFNFPDIDRQPFWDDFIFWVNSSNGYKRLFRNSCKKYGLPIK